MGVRINTQGMTELFGANLENEYRAMITSNLEYMPALEGGHSEQAPEGMVDVNLPSIRALFEHDVAALDPATITPRDLERVVTEAALFGLGEIVTDTPVDTGRAKGSWVVTLPDGTAADAVALGVAPPAGSEETAKLRKKARARVARRKRKGG